MMRDHGFHPRDLVDRGLAAQRQSESENTSTLVAKIAAFTARLPYMPSMMTAMVAPMYSAMYTGLAEEDVAPLVGIQVHQAEHLTIEVAIMAPKRAYLFIRFLLVLVV
jgi:hypothetical protein